MTLCVSTSDDTLTTTSSESDKCTVRYRDRHKEKFLCETFFHGKFFHFDVRTRSHSNYTHKASALGERSYNEALCFLSNGKSFRILHR